MFKRKSNKLISFNIINFHVKSVSLVFLLFSIVFSTFATPGFKDFKNAVNKVQKIEKKVESVKKSAEQSKADSEAKKELSAENAKKEAAKKRIKSLPKASSELRAAAIDDNEAEAKRLIAAGENPDSVFNGITMMGEATTHGSAKVVKVLLDAGVDPNAACNQYGSVPLMNAARTDRASPALVKLLIAAGADVNATVDRYSILHRACENSTPEVVKILIDSGADVNYANGNTTPISMSINPTTPADSLAKVKLLVKAKADVNTYIPVGAPSLNEVTKFLIDSGADVNKVVDQGRWGKSTLLVEAVRGENLGAVKMLVQAKADLKATAKGGMSPLHVAATREYANTKSYAGTARYNNISEIVRYLAKAGMNVEARTDDDETPLMLAAMYGCGGVIDALVECGAKVNARTKSGKTALTLAKSQLTDSDTSGAVKALIKHGGTM
ncbi:ankyrin repeat domain-containing protein [Treponema sp.]|uniref:ankyrin repeat domain-containing protein n=1 Tax=Treponema sp. TaxID=166 RepID=UPI003F0FB15B